MDIRHIRAIGGIAVICIIIMTLSGATGDPDKISVEQLLIKRTDIMENVLSGNISLEEGKEQLKNIEKGKLYTDDINNLISNMNCEHNKVLDMKINDINKKNDISDLMVYEGNIIWKCSGIDGLYTEEFSYIIGVDNTDEELKLVSFEIVE